MQPRLIVRHPHIFSSPKALATELGILTRVPTARKPGDYRRDFFMGYPEPEFVRHGGREYADLADFFGASKAGQRQRLERHGVPIPQTRLARTDALQGDRFVVRPLRHQGGSHYRTTTNPTDFREGSEYISELFPKTHEYRIVYVYGSPVIVLRKKPVEGRALTAEEPWNHGNTTFQTINRPGEGKLAAHTDCFTRLLDLPLIRNSHYLGVDILYNHHNHRYVVCEINSSPALQIDENRVKVAEFIRARAA